MIIDSKHKAGRQMDVSRQNTRLPECSAAVHWPNFDCSLEDPDRKFFNAKRWGR